MARAVILIAILAAVGVVVVRVLRDGRALTARHGEAARPGQTEARSPAHRTPAVAGQFYPADADELRAEVTGYLDQAPEATAPGELVALIVPHAGYSYSAGVAAYAYRQLKSKHFDTVMVVGPSHGMPFRGVALSGADLWDTPLGPVAIDRAGCEALLKADDSAHVLDEAHASEHCIEVQLPFLQSVLRDFRLLPVLMADFSEENCSVLARALAEWARGRSALLVASSDMSHYPAYDDANRADAEILAAIETMDTRVVSATSQKLLSEGISGLRTCLCGEGPVRAVLMASRLLGAGQVKVLRYANSGDIAGGPRNRVVGYCSVGIYREAGAGESSPAQARELSPAQQQRLLSLAREAIEQYVTTGRRLDIHETDPALRRRAAVFVTLEKRGELRGCIGSLQPDSPLCEAVRDKAIAAATGDPRFPPVTGGELADLEVEVSVLSPLQPVDSPDEIRLPEHGVVVEGDGRRGVFLPQVARDTGWDRDELLDHLCRDKAGLRADAWRHGAKLYVFTVQSFGSPAPGERRDGRRPGK